MCVVVGRWIKLYQASARTEYICSAKWTIHNLEPHTFTHKHHRKHQCVIINKAFLCVFDHYKVIRGGDGSAGLAIRHPNGQLVKAYEWLPSSDYSEPTSTGGYYAICLDNQFSRFASKLVNIYITVIKYDQWTKYAQEIEGLQLNMQNFTVIEIPINAFFSLHSN